MGLEFLQVGEKGINDGARPLQQVIRGYDEDDKRWTRVVECAFL